MSVHRDETRKNKWVVIYKNHKKRGFDSKRDAQIYESKLKLNELNINCNKRFNDVINLYLDDLMLNNSFATYYKAKQVFESYIKPNFKNKKISAISEIDCKNFKNVISNLNLSTKSKNYILNKFKAVFIYSETYFNSLNNCYKVIQPFKKTFEEIKKSNVKIENVWSDKDFYQFINYISNDKYKLFFTLLFFTGIRLGEAQALTWEDIHGNILRINKSLSKCSKNGSYEIKQPKTYYSIRDISLNDELVKELYNYKKIQESIKGFENSWFIFGNIYPIARTTLTRYLNKGICESGVKKITVHGFRHSHASNLIAKGVNIVAVSRRLGHSDVNITLKIYTHLMPKNEKELLEVLNNSFQNLSIS